MRSKSKLRSNKPNAEFNVPTQWAKARQVWRLNMEDIQMAKQLGMSPKSLMKNNPSPSQRWKLQVKHWIRELHLKRFGHQHPAKLQPARTSVTTSPAEAAAFDENVPF